jgi:hypothetical protein
LAVPDPYRGEDDAARIAALDARITALEARFSRMFWERVAPCWDIARAPVLSTVDDRHARIELLEAALERASRGVRAAPDFVRPPVERSVARLGLADDHKTLREAATVFAGGDAHGRVVAALAERSSIRARHDGVPIDAILKYWDGQTTFRHWSICTTAAPTLRVHARPEGVLDAVLSTFKIKSDVTLGDPRFDAEFLVRGDEPSVRAVLSARVRGDLIRLGGRMNGVELRVKDGLAVLTVASMLGPLQAHVALGVLTDVHSTPSPYSALVEP